jgi:hypothetical protein
LDGGEENSVWSFRPLLDRPARHASRGSRQRAKCRSNPSERSSRNFANPSIPPLQLSQAQRATIQQALSSEDTEVSFALKAAKSAQNFEPSLGAKIPNALKLHPLPRPLIYRIEPLKHYIYVKFKHQILIVNPMTRKIVDMFQESGLD